MKNGDLKLVTETAKSFEVASKGSQIMKGGDNVHSQAKNDPEVKRVSRPGRYSIRSKGPDQTAGCSQAQARPGCTKCGNEAHVDKNACPVTGRICLKCGHLNHFARMFNKASNGGKNKEANSVELEQEIEQEVYRYQLKKGKSQNSTVSLNINGIPISLHLDMQADITVVTEKHYGKLQAICTLQPTSVEIRNYSREGNGPVLPLLGKFAAPLTRGEKEIVYVVKGQGDMALLSRQATKRMGRVEYHLDLTWSTPLPVMGESRQATIDLVEEYKDVFSGLGKFKSVKLNLHMDPDTKGAVQKHISYRSKTSLIRFSTNRRKWISLKM